MKHKVEDYQHFLKCNDRWKDSSNRSFEEGREDRERLDGFQQCMLCAYFVPLSGSFINDWGACTYVNSPFDGLVRYEHDGCSDHVEAEDQWQLQIPARREGIELGKMVPYKAIKVEPSYGENIIVYVKHKEKKAWYVTTKDFWYLDLIKLKQGYRRMSGDYRELTYLERFFINILDSDSAGTFLEAIKICKADPAELRGLVRERLEEIELFSRIEAENEFDESDNYDDLQDYLPSLYVDFDEKLLLSQYPGAIAFERYLPQGWKGSYEPFLELVAAGDRYWLDGGDDLFAGRAEIES